MATKEKYAFAHDFGAGSNNYTFKGPKGKKGLLLDYGIEGVTETFNEVTTAATISVGIAANLDAYGEEIDIGCVDFQPRWTERLLVERSKAGEA